MFLRNSSSSSNKTKLGIRLIPWIMKRKHILCLSEYLHNLSFGY